MKQRWLLALPLVLLSLGSACSTTALRYTRTQLPTLGGYASPAKINNDGHIVGTCDVSLGNLPHVVRWLPDGTLQDFGPGYGCDVNTLGDILGIPLYSAVSVWDISGACTELPWDVFALRFNDVGQFVGLIPSQDGLMHGFIWTQAEGLLDIGVPTGSNYSCANMLNNSGVVVGNAHTFNGQFTNARAFRWTAETGPVALSMPAGSSQSTADDMNELGQIVGYCSDSQGSSIRAVLWEPDGQTVDLGNAFARAINNRGADTPELGESGESGWQYHVA